MLKYTLVVTLLLSIGLSIFSAWHNPEHILKTDQHCALCLYSLNLEHSLPVNIQHIVDTTFSCVMVFIAPRQYISTSIRISGNRDPPTIH
jgi:hypothetical protein